MAPIDRLLLSISRIDFKGILMDVAESIFLSAFPVSN